MRISLISNHQSKKNTPSFKAHFYDVKLYGNYEFLDTLKIDNKPELGDEPYLMVKNKAPVKMKKVSDGFVTNIQPYSKLDYQIFYKDTQKIDSFNNSYYSVDRLKLLKQASIADKMSHNQPLEKTIAKGSAKGRLLVVEKTAELNALIKNNPSLKNEPIILVSKTDDSFEPHELPPNVIGVVLAEGSIGKLSHNASALRSKMTMVAILYDEKKLNSLLQLDNKYALVSTNNNKLEFKELDSLLKIKNVYNSIDTEIKIPKIREVNALINSTDYEADTVGSKAYKLKVLEEMVDNNKLKGIKIPKSFAVPKSYIEKLYDTNTKWASLNQKLYTDTLKNIDTDKNAYKTLFKILNSCFTDTDNKYMNEIINLIAKKGMNFENLMVRSSFNGEDIENYSAAGLYDSFMSFDKDTLMHCIFQVNASKWNDRAYNSRVENKIPHADVQATALIQERIDADYTFTIYTKGVTSDEDILLLEMNSKMEKFGDDNRDPYLLKYDRKTNDLSLSAIERNWSTYTFDENKNIVNSKVEKDKLLKNWATMKPILENVVNNALVLEKEFNAPQDVEGGIKDGQIYFWQTRNIV